MLSPLSLIFGYEPYTLNHSRGDLRRNTSYESTSERVGVLHEFRGIFALTWGLLSSFLCVVGICTF
jgi:hypothetical protein